MPTTFYGIDSYKIYHFDEGYPVYTAMIQCYRGLEFKVQLDFYKDGESIPASYKNSARHLFLKFNEHKLRDIVETLRLEEKPLYITFDEDRSVGYISTSEEPVEE